MYFVSLKQWKRGGKIFDCVQSMKKYPPISRKELFKDLVIYYIFNWNKTENSSIFFVITVNENPLYLKIWSNSIHPALQMVTLYLGNSWSLFVKQTTNALTRIYISEISVSLKTHSQKSGKNLRKYNIYNIQPVFQLLYSQ